MILRAFWKAPTGRFGVLFLGLLAAVALIAPEVWGHDALSLNVGRSNQGPTLEHFLGTDQLGRDLLLRLIVATRLSLGLSVAATAIGGLVGIPLGAFGALLGGRAKELSLRLIDTLLAFPSILVAMFVSAILGPGSMSATVGAALALCFFFARVASSLTLSVVGLDYISAARVLGISRVQLLLRYILPNISETLFITMAVAVGTSIVTVSSLSFLGLGVQPPEYDWGRMLTEGVQTFYLTPVAALAPAGAIAVAALAFGFTGEALARATNPVLWVTEHRSQMGVRDAQERDAQSARVYRDDRTLRSVEGVLRGDVVLDVADLNVTFESGGFPIRAVQNVSFRLRRGERLGIVGESGSGKTTLAMALAYLIPYPGRVTGSIAFEGRSLEGLSGRQRDKLLATQLAVIFQDPMSSLNPALTIGTQLTEKVAFHLKSDRRTARTQAAQSLRDVNLPTPVRQLARYPNELSGGMRQRVMIAMGLMTTPAVLIADEPTTALDVTIQAQIMDLLERLNGEHNLALVLISHNLALVSQICDQILVMYAGTVVEDLSTADLMSSPLHPYTRALLAAVPDLDRARDIRLAEIGGQIPEPQAVPPGCPFHPRCPVRIDRCTSELPPLETVADGRRVACWVAAGSVE